MAASNTGGEERGLGGRKEEKDEEIGEEGGMGKEGVRRGGRREEKEEEIGEKGVR